MQVSCPRTQIPEPLSSQTWRGNVICMTESTITPVVPIRASTVILIRDMDGPFQVYLLKRSSRSSFMPGNYVFPGGIVDPEDMGFDFWKDHVDMNSGQIKRGFGRGLNVEDAMAHGIAAVRETFEEACLFLADNTGGAGSDFENLQEPRLKRDPFQGLASRDGSFRRLDREVVGIGALVPLDYTQDQVEKVRYQVFCGLYAGEPGMPTR